MKKILTSQHKIRFQDCDPFRHLNNAKYLDYFLNAREDQVAKHYDLHIFDHIRTTGAGWVVTSNQIAYFSPASMLEIVTVQSQLIGHSAKSLTVEMRMWDQAEIQLKSLLWVNFVHYNLRENTSQTHQDDLLALFAQVEEPIDTNDFQQRCRSLLSRHKEVAEKDA